MSASLNNTLRLSSSLKMEEEAKLNIEKQGIVSILGSDCERAKTASLRRTLSADMSSKKWLAQHGFSHSHMKKIASSQQFTVSAAADSSSSSEGEDDYEDRKEVERPGMFQTWSSILSQKGGGDDPAKSGAGPAPLLPYVHPLVKRSASSLSERSLQICTESLGSETGSDGFSISSSANNTTKECKEESHHQQQQKLHDHGKEESNPSLGVDEDLLVVEIDNNYSVRKRLLQPPSSSSFPPPLPSLSAATQGPNVRFQTHRRNGRLVLEAVSVPAQNYFQAQRHGGRLVLTLANAPFNYEDMSDQEQKEEEEEEAEDLGQELENFEEIDEDENGEAAAGEGKVVKVGQAKEFMAEMEEAAPKLPTGMINVHRSALMMKKLMGLVNMNPTWPPKLNKAANLEEATPRPPPPRVARIISTPPTVAAASSFNAYEYCWRSKPTTANAILNPPSIPLNNNNNNNNNEKFILSKSSNKAHEQQQLLLLRGNKAEYSLPLLRGCKEPRRSLLIWEPYCIATS